jgi:hypothetical protein
MSGTEDPDVVMSFATRQDECFACDAINTTWYYDETTDRAIFLCLDCGYES